MSLQAAVLAYLPYVTLALSIISLTVAILAYRRTSSYMQYEYAPRLEVADESIRLGHPRSVLRSFQPNAFEYSVRLVNRSLKPIDIERIRMDYGDRGDPTKRFKHLLDGRLSLVPGGSHPIEFSLSWNDVDRAKQQFATERLGLFLSIEYMTPQGKRVEAQHEIAGWDHMTPIFMAPFGSRIS